MIKTILLMLVAFPAFAQQPFLPVVVQPVPTHKFLDATNITLQTISAACMAADIASTKRALAQPGAYEANPLAKSQTALISLKVAGFGAGIGIAYMMHRSGHHKAERIVLGISGVPSALAAAHNATIK